MEVIEAKEVFDMNTYSSLADNEQWVNGDEPCEIPRDENGKIIGVPWEIIRERMYDNLSKHYGVDLKTL